MQSGVTRIPSRARDQRKDGAKDVKKYYSKLDVAVVVELVTRQGSRTSIAIPVSSTAKPAIRLGNALSLILPRLD